MIFDSQMASDSVQGDAVFHRLRAKSRSSDQATDHFIYKREFDEILRDFKNESDLWNFFIVYAESHKNGKYWEIKNPEEKFSVQLRDIINKNTPSGEGLYGNGFFYGVISGILSQEFGIKNVWGIEVPNG